MPMSSVDIAQYLAQWESLGVGEVRKRLVSEEYGTGDAPLRKLVEDWLTSKELEHKAASDARFEAREEKSLSISRKALFNSRCATIIAIIATIIAMSDKFISFLQWLGVLKP